jgi:hypothetical protein
MSWKSRAKSLSVVNPGSTTDEYGNVTPSWTTGATTVTEKGLIQETQSTEVTVGRDTVVTSLIVILPVASVVTSHSRIIANGLTYEVVGNPTVYDTGSPGVRHAEAHLVSSSG